MKFIKVITLTLISFSSQVLSITASAPIDRLDEEQSRGRFLRDQGGQPMANPDNCPAPSRRQVIGNKCLGPNQVPTVCCGRNKMRSYVACMPPNLQTCFTGGRASGRGADMGMDMLDDVKDFNADPKQNSHTAPSKTDTTQPCRCKKTSKSEWVCRCEDTYVKLGVHHFDGRGNSGHGTDTQFHSDSDSPYTLSLSAVSDQPNIDSIIPPCSDYCPSTCHCNQNACDC